MSVTRINEFQAKPGQEEALKAFLEGVVSGIAATAGCASCQLLQALDEPARFVVLEVWSSRAAHQSAAHAIAPDEIAKVMAMLAAPPKGAYFG
jgi:quinol monooxygenase YgiN